MADMQMVGEKTEGVEEIIVEDVIQPAMHTAPHPASPSADHQASVFGSPPQPPQPPPDVSACIIQGLMPLQGAEGVPGSGTMVAGAVPSSAMLGALTLVPIAKVGEGLPGGIKEDKQLPFMHAADKALRDAKKRERTEDAEERRNNPKKRKEDEIDAEDKYGPMQKLCPHNRPKNACSECMGCPHGKRRQNCKDCNAGSRQWCHHGKRRHDCQDCSGCTHGRIKRSCKDCNGSGICEHGKLKRSCRDCSTDMCEHKRRRYYCRECQGAGSCEHNNRRWRCRECNGCYTCQHGLIKTNCIECEVSKTGGSSGDMNGGAATKPFEPEPLQAHMLHNKTAQSHAPPPHPDDLDAPSQDPSLLLGKAALGAGGIGDVDSEDRTTFQHLAISLPPLTPAALVGLLADSKDVGGVATGDPVVDAAAAAAAVAMGVLSAGPPNINATMGVLTDKQVEEAGQSRVCIHKRWRVFCAECGGTGLCTHGKRKGTCKTCGGTQFCEHKRLRRQCRTCRPELKAQKIALCPHKKRKARCRECGGSQFCEHGKNKDWCKECGGRRLCEHQRQKHQCRECCALNMCPHKTTDQCVGKSGKERGRPRIHAEKSKVAGARRGRPPKSQNHANDSNGSGMEMEETNDVGQEKPEGCTSSSSLAGAPPPPPLEVAVTAHVAGGSGKEPALAGGGGKDKTGRGVTKGCKGADEVEVSADGIMYDETSMQTVHATNALYLLSSHALTGKSLSVPFCPNNSMRPILACGRWRQYVSE